MSLHADSFVTAPPPGGTDAWRRLSSEFSDVWLDIDLSGAPAAIGVGDGRGIALRTKLSLQDGGSEARGLDGGLVYPGSVDVHATAGATVRVSAATVDARHHRVVASTDAPDRWEVLWHYHFRASWPRIGVSVEIVALDEGAVVRNATVELHVLTEPASEWTVHSPGNQLRCDVPLAEITAAFDVLPISAVSGSTGLVVFERAGADTITLWPMSPTEIGDVWVTPEDGGPLLHWQADIGGVPGCGGSLRAGPLQMDFVAEPFEALLPRVPETLAKAGIEGPDDPPEWARAASIYEVQIGFSVFPDDFRYAPYPTASDLLADLDRIQQLGFDTLQLMPRQPYPSYNIHDYADITTSYGDEAVLRELVRECHQRGMRVICDLLLHGVIDGEVIEEAMESIRNGPYGARLDEEMPDITILTRGEMDGILLTWCRHVMDFGPYWAEGSPRRHPLVDSNPDWFCTDSAGHITSRYTRAFDVAHPGWQRYFIDSALDIMRRLDLDGFRLDAPSYNYFHNWSPRTRANASVSMLGALPLFAQLRTALRAHNPEALLYTEPSGALWRTSMDLNYNYDELWLIRAVLTGGAGYEQGIRNAKELGDWLTARDAALPRGSMTAHHLDSHDTFWWPAPGKKWRREQYGRDATAALFTAFALSGEPYMTFVGGEVGIEERVATVHTLRRTHPELAVGVSDRAAVDVTSDDVYRVVRRPEWGSDRGTLVLVNLSPAPQRCSVTLAAAGHGVPTGDDLLGSVDRMAWRRDQDTLVADLTMAPFEARVAIVDTQQG